MPPLNCPCEACRLDRHRDALRKPKPKTAYRSMVSQIKALTRRVKQQAYELEGYRLLHALDEDSAPTRKATVHVFQRVGPAQGYPSALMLTLKLPIDKESYEDHPTQFSRIGAEVLIRRAHPPRKRQ